MATLFWTEKAHDRAMGAGSVSSTVDALRSQLIAVRPYPAGMREIPAEPHGIIAGRSFFPGGDGLFNGRAQQLPDRPLLVVGNDFGTFDDDYVGAARAGRELLAGTWNGIESILGKAGVDPCSCFFTNAIMGARVSGPNTGSSPALKDGAFIMRCAHFLRTQISLLRPRGVVMIGKVQTKVVGLAIERLAPIGRCKTWRQIDDFGMQFAENLTLGDCPPFRFCALMHPCLRAGNMSQHGRRFRGLRDDAAEVALLRAVTA